MPRLPLHEEFTRHSEWYQPDRPHIHVPGSLAFSPDHIRLDLNDAFSAIDGDVSIADPVTTYPALHGASTKGELLTLLRAARASVGLSFGPAGVRQPETVTSSWLVVGAHVRADETYRSLTFFIPGLAAWLGQTPINCSYVHAEGEQAYSEHIVRTPQKPEATRVDTSSMTVRWGAGTSSSINVFERVHIDVLGWIEIVPDHPQSLEWFFEQYEKLSAMLTILAGDSIPAESITLRLTDSDYSAELLVCMKPAKYCRLRHPGDFYFPRNFTKIPLSELVQRWFQEIDSVLVPSQLAVSTLNSSGLWLHVKFLSLIQVLEGFHRGRFAGEYLDAEAYDAIKAALNSALPKTLASDHKDSLRSRIRYGNQLSLSRRLTELASLLGDDVSIRVFGVSTKIPRAWIDTRNYFTHWDKDLLSNTLEGQALYNATVRMEHFVRALFLTLSGVECTEITKAIDHTSQCAQQLAQVNIIERHKADPSQPKGTLYTVRTKPVTDNQQSQKPERSIPPE
ncbi:ApeA N-terminal domain 1-containing protein [Rubrivivax gelatinosus]|nr:HEPN domain-containing protein [Rubrivivax gelatinosus]